MARVDNRQPLDYEQVTSLSASTALTVPGRAKAALIQAETQSVRFTDDGSTPTATVGMRLLKDSTMWYDGKLTALRFIEEAASAKLNVLYYA